MARVRTTGCEGATCDGCRSGNSSLPQLTARAATQDDAAMLFAWANDPETRAASRSSNPIAYEGHCQWLSSKLASKDSWIFIANLGNLPVAQLRLDKIDGSDSLRISYSVAKESRGMGIGTALIAMIPDITEAQGIKYGSLVAETLVSNTASNRVFLRAGYTLRKRASDGIGGAGAGAGAGAGSSGVATAGSSDGGCGGCNVYVKSRRRRQNDKPTAPRLN